MSICVYDSLPDEAVEIRENVFVKEHGKRRKEIEMKRRKIILKLINRAIGIDSLHEPRKHKRSAYDQAR